jgi:formate dehydrogenase major subunit
MKITRRTFLKVSGATAAATLMSGLGFDLSPIAAYAQEARIKGAKETLTICPYCSVGCGIIVHTATGTVTTKGEPLYAEYDSIPKGATAGTIINTEGDPDHPINEGSLCAKGMALYQLVTNNNRLTNVRYRAPHSTRWETKSWDWAVSEIGKRIKKSRDASFMEKNGKGQVVNRTDGIAAVGSTHINNEECWLYLKFLRSLGLVYVEHEARL